MSTVFDLALATLHADPNLSVSGTWSRGGSSAAVRVTLSAPDITMQVAGPGETAPDAVAHLPVSALAQTPALGDTLTIDGTAYAIVAAQRDAERITWRLGLRAPRPTTTAGTALAAAVP